MNTAEAFNIDVKQTQKVEAVSPGERHNLAEVIQGSSSGRSLQPGFYVASGNHALVSQVEERLVDLLCQEHMTSAFKGLNTSVSSFPRKRESSRNLIHNHGFPIKTFGNDGGGKMPGRIIWIDSGNSFNAYHVATEAAKRRMDPKRILRAIQVARPFTAFQLQQMLEKIPRPSFSYQNVTAPLSPPLVVISDLMGLFYDSEIQEKDVQRAFRGFLSKLPWLEENAIVLGLLMKHPTPFQRRFFMPYLLKTAQMVRVPVETQIIPPEPVKKEAPRLIQRDLFSLAGARG